jgi:hypothetical protein
MKCIWHWKIKENWHTDGGKFMETSAKFRKALEENPDDFPKMSESLHTGNGEGFRLVEGTEEQLANLVAIWSPVEDWKLEVYLEAKPGSPYTKALQRWYP